RPLLAERPQVDACALRGFVERRLHFTVRGGQLGQHADRLRALAREDEGKVGMGGAHANLFSNESNGQKPPITPTLFPAAPERGNVCGAAFRFSDFRFPALSTAAAPRPR